MARSLVCQNQFDKRVSVSIVAMTLEPHVSSALLLFALLNPFLMSIYLLDLITDLPRAVFVRVLARGALISGAVVATGLTLVAIPLLYYELHRSRSDTSALSERTSS